MAGAFTTKVTILIAARNEEAGIRYTIDDIIAQDYPKHLTEIIIVDDHSTDDTAAIIRSYADRGIKLLQLNEDKPLKLLQKESHCRSHCPINRRIDGLYRCRLPHG
jgi:glycosyltransferase involved in cell wall biosynthesis